MRGKNKMISKKKWNKCQEIKDNKCNLIQMTNKEHWSKILRRSYKKRKTLNSQNKKMRLKEVVLKSLEN